MKKDEFINTIKEALQRDGELTEDMVLAELEEWDSLAALSIIAIFDKYFSIKYKYNDISKLYNIGDLIKLANGKLE
ncbi:hypothetical protein A2276_05935 [candidate division WOR-1 bacterium RIFOXYA12_FULL_43_27]|uniref:Carrier domain-containing protein n=1 Tax=candidate division WOR-1 bacterium RIFOXYC2_FULL_46_14 TaxID=1802587 RepID=A0A1F4U598_UNCSA|nr:MAG: hypothetical protein A2276_05935 [candidate division WOR-1 bacterium RIFOXYA12_FULL_43_27]OGC20201.1 MAG: hypothetical protein A2292_03935 [candidate division WOR-1 bacterium RIFOXYB2_FULL_46_45]OGC32061.1 MAG: hypothetical protein A2232_07510 [candidate division WOR-1 bacterium RIFOXYA2_FULL_46_56]OGC39463.1 MAG: hypothetical protein A2438_07875 [candidate division WOR-1 bacterium RIFOXYC2_FULL_46_14]